MQDCQGDGRPVTLIVTAWLIPADFQPLVILCSSCLDKNTIV